MALEGVNNNYKNVYGSKEDFKTFADYWNSTFPDTTSTVNDKRDAIAAKTKILEHPGCPASTRIVLQKEIEIIKSEIAAIEKETNLTSSIFDKRSDLG